MGRAFAFVFSGVFSLFLYIALIFSFTYIYLGSIFEPKKFSITTKTTIAPIEVSLVSESDDEKAKDEVEDVKSTETGSQSAKKSSVDKNLFEALESYDKPKEEKQLSFDDKKSSRLKGDTLRAKKSASKVVNNLNLKEVKTDNLNLKSTLGDSDPYYDKILQILSRWSPAGSGSDKSATVRFDIKQSGLYSFSILKSSGDGDFDKSISYFLEDIAALPSHDKNRDLVIEVTFKTKD